jgi:signal transduction histidine kinase
MDVQQITNPNTENSSSMLRLWIWLTKIPSGSKQERSARLVAVMAGSLSTAFVVTAAWIIVTTGLGFSGIALLLTGAILATSYILNRQDNYDAAAIALIGAIAVVPAVFVLGMGKDIRFLELSAVISSLSVMLTGVLLSKQNWSLATMLIIIGLYLVVPLVYTVYTFTEAIYAIGSILIISLMTVVLQNHRAAVEHDQIAKLEAINVALVASEAGLRKANAMLDREVKDRDIELKAVEDEYERAVLETEQAKEQSDRANHVKSAFLASMSHELRTPLNAIINFTKFVIKGDLGKVNPEQVETLTEVVNSGKHLLNLINDVLDMSKIESGSLNLFIEDSVDLPNIVNYVMSTGKSLLADKPVELTVSMDANLPLMRADRQRIVQVLLNLMSNACKFTSEGSIAVRVRHDNADIVISVQDSGPGIGPEDQSLVFEAFKQTEAGLRQGGGTGLGMPISKNLVEAHGGRIWLESEQGKGTTFFVSLPVKAEHLVATFSPAGVIK